MLLFVGFDLVLLVGLWSLLKEMVDFCFDVLLLFLVVLFLVVLRLLFLLVEKYLGFFIVLGELGEIFELGLCVVDCVVFMV